MHPTSNEQVTPAASNHRIARYGVAAAACSDVEPDEDEHHREQDCDTYDQSCRHDPQASREELTDCRFSMRPVTAEGSYENA